MARVDRFYDRKVRLSHALCRGMIQHQHRPALVTSRGGVVV